MSWFRSGGRGQGGHVGLDVGMQLFEKRRRTCITQCDQHVMRRPAHAHRPEQACIGQFHTQRAEGFVHALPCTLVQPELDFGRRVGGDLRVELADRRATAPDPVFQRAVAVGPSSVHAMLSTATGSGRSGRAAGRQRPCRPGRSATDFGGGDHRVS